MHISSTLTEWKRKQYHHQQASPSWGKQCPVHVPLRNFSLYILCNCFIFLLCLSSTSRPFHKVSPQIEICIFLRLVRTHIFSNPIFLLSYSPVFFSRNIFSQYCQEIIDFLLWTVLCSHKFHQIHFKPCVTHHKILLCLLSLQLFL